MKVEKIAGILRDACGVGKEARIILGFSGGADSVCLLDILIKLGYQPVIAYFNHHLRKNVNDEVLFARKMANKYGCECVIGGADIPTLANADGRGIEETARTHRYKFLTKTAVENASKFVAVAHHADDQVETVLMHILRGAGLRGLSGMRYASSCSHNLKVNIIRPMLNIWKEEILAYCHANALDFCQDETNADPNYFRNRVRLQLIPELETHNPNFRMGLARMASILKADADLLSSLTDQALPAIVDDAKKDFVKLRLIEFKKKHKSIQRMVIIRFLTQYFGLEENTEFTLVENLRHLFSGAYRSKSVQVNNTIHALVEGDTGFIFRFREDLFTENELVYVGDKKNLNVAGLTPINDHWEIQCEDYERGSGLSEVYSNTDPMIAYINKKCIKKGLHLRPWQEGDRYAPLGMGGHSMKVSDFWINKKVPLRLKTVWPLIFSGDQLIWIPGFQPSHHARVTEDMDPIIRIQVRRKSD